MNAKTAAVILCLILALGPTSAASGRERGPAVIEGKIFDRDTQDPLPAYVLSEEGESCSADSRGAFKLPVRNPAAGKIKLTVFLLGYKKREVEARPGVSVSIGLELEPLAPREISVTADSVVSDAKNQKTITLDKMDIYRLPGAAADPVYASHVLPGINSPPDASSLLIRGGAPDEVGYFFDGIEIEHPFLSESLHESYFSIFDNQVVEAFSVATSGLPPKYGDALSGVMEISAKDLLAKSEGGLGLSIMGLNSYIGFPLRGVGSFVGSYNRGYSDLLTRLNSREGERDFGTEHAFGKLILRLNPSQALRVYGLYDGYRYAEGGQGEAFSLGSKNWMTAVSWTASWSQALVTKALLSATRFDLSFDQPEVIRVQNRDDIVALRLEAMWDLGRHFLEWGADFQARRIETELSDPNDRAFAARGKRFGFFINDKFRLTDRLYLNAGFRVSALDLVKQGGSIDPRVSAAYLLTKNDVLRFSTGVYHQYGDYSLLQRNPDLRPKAAVHYSLSYDHITEALEMRATAYDKEYKDLYLNELDGSTTNGGFGFARGAELFLKKKSRRHEILVVYNFLRSRRKDNDRLSSAPSPYEIVHSATAIAAWKIGKTEVGLRYSIASGRPYTPLAGREWDPVDQAFAPVWGEPYSARYPAYRRLDLTGHTSFTLWNRLVVLYFGLTNALNDTNILRYDYTDDYAGRRDQPSIFGRSLFLGLYVPFF
jgi:hypothetical protein